MKRLVLRSTLLVVGVVAAWQSTGAGPAMAAAPMAQAGAGPQWTTLLDGTSLTGWDVLGTANWRVANGSVEADAGEGFLVSPVPYGNFRLRVEVWTDPDANSGVFIRCSNPKEIGAATCYEVNIFDKRPDPKFRTGAIVNLAPPLVQIDAANRWNTLEITAEGSHLVVRLNDTLTVDATDAKLASGPFALQRGAGIVRFRRVQIMPLS